MSGLVRLLFLFIYFALLSKIPVLLGVHNVHNDRCMIFLHILFLDAPQARTASQAADVRPSATPNSVRVTWQ